MRWMLVIVLAACGGGYEAPQPVCAICASDSDCESGLCRMYGDGHKKCTFDCGAGSTAPQCEDPSTGFCNFMGYCMCPNIPMFDAGVPDDSYRDAPEMPMDAS